jgi:hypothetical protein
MNRALHSGRRRHSRGAFVAHVETMERLCLLSDFTMLSVTQTSGTTLSFDYQVQVPNISTLEVDFYRSATPVFDAPADVEIGSRTLSGSELTEGTHDDVTAVLNAPLPSGAAPLTLDPAHPYVFAVATGPDNVTTDASYQTFIVSAVTHGLTLPPSFSNTPPAWVPAMAASLRADGYNKVFAFSWSRTSGLPIPGEGTKAGNRMAGEIEKFLEKPGDVPAGAVVDIQLIGHSRGSVVITQAMQDLEGNLSSIPQAAGGYWLLTYLDPHPAHADNIVNFGVADNAAGRAALAAANFVQRHAADPYPLVVPSHVTEVQDYYENTPANLTPLLSTERVLNPWGTFPPNGITLASPSTTVMHVLNLTAPGIGHSEVHEWYQDNVVPLLSTATPFITAPIDAPISASSRAVVAFGYAGLVVRMTDADPTSTSSDFTGTINWGDGTPSPATFSGYNLTGFFSFEHHAYSTSGRYTYTVKIDDVGGATTTTSGRIFIS